MANLHLGSLLKCDSCIWNYHSQWESDPLIWDPNTRVTLHIPFLRYMCVSVSCLIQIPFLWFFQSTLYFCSNHPQLDVSSTKVAICVCCWPSKTWNLWSNGQISSDQKTNLKWHRDTSLRTASWRRMQIWFAAEESWSAGKSLGVFLLGAGAEGCFRGGETEPKNVSTFKQCLCCIFSSDGDASCLKEFVFVCFPSEWWKLLIRGGTPSMYYTYITCTDLDRRYIIAHNNSMRLRHYLGKILNGGFN